MLTMDSRPLDRTVSDVISTADIGKYLSRTGQALQRGTGTACTIVKGPFLHGMWSRFQMMWRTAITVRQFPSFLIPSPRWNQGRRRNRVRHHGRCINGSVRYCLPHDGVPVPAPLDSVMSDIIFQKMESYPDKVLERGPSSIWCIFVYVAHGMHSSFQRFHPSFPF